jgi:hypothetical protein
MTWRKFPTLLKTKGGAPAALATRSFLDGVGLDAFRMLVVRLALGVRCDRTSFIGNEGAEWDAGICLRDVQGAAEFWFWSASERRDGVPDALPEVRVRPGAVGHSGGARQRAERVCEDVESAARSGDLELHRSCLNTEGVCRGGHRYKNQLL